MAISPTPEAIAKDFILVTEAIAALRLHLEQVHMRNAGVAAKFVLECTEEGIAHVLLRTRAATKEAVRRLAGVDGKACAGQRQLHLRTMSPMKPDHAIWQRSVVDKNTRPTLNVTTRSFGRRYAITHDES